MRYITVLESDDDGFHAIIIDIADDECLWITDSFKTKERAERAALNWVSKYLAALEANQGRAS